MRDVGREFIDSLLPRVGVSTSSKVVAACGREGR